jgi:cell division protease FtsH
LGKDKAVDLSAVARVTDGLSGAELEMIVNEAAIRAVRRVSNQLNKGIGEHSVDTTVYPQDFEASVESFFQSRNQKKTPKQFGFDVERSAGVSTSPAGIFFRA